MIDPCAPRHECDQCPKCQAGHCCRNEVGYQLPELGSIQPFSGELGVRRDLGDKVECHVCGDWYGSLAVHIWFAHDINSFEYKAAFGLTKRGLTSADVHAKKAAAMRRRMASGEWKPMRNPPKPTPEQRAAGNEKLESRLHRTEASRQTLPKLMAASHSPEAVKKMRATKARQSEAYREERACVECGRAFTIQRYIRTPTCSDECLSKHRSRTATASINRRIAEGRGPEPPAMTEERRAMVSAKHKQRWANMSPEKRASERARVTSYLTRIPMEQKIATRRKIAEGQAYRRKPHPCSACGKVIPKATPITCSPECRREIRRRTAQKSLATRRLRRAAVT